MAGRAHDLVREAVAIVRKRAGIQRLVEAVATIDAARGGTGLAEAGRISPHKE